MDIMVIINSSIKFSIKSQYLFYDNTILSYLKTILYLKIQEQKFTFESRKGAISFQK